MSYHNVVYSIEDGIAYANFANRNKTVWNERWFKSFDVAYAISATITNGTISSTGTIFGGDTIELVITPNEGYTFPSSVTVTGATASYAEATGKLTLTNPVSNVTITAECEIESFDVTIRGDQIDSAMFSAWYSVNDGQSWIPIDQITAFVVKTKQIKFKISNSSEEELVGLSWIAPTSEEPYPSQFVDYIWVFQDPQPEPSVSENFVLTENKTVYAWKRTF